MLFTHVCGLHLTRGIGAVHVKGTLGAAVQLFDVQIMTGKNAIILAFKAVITHVAILLVGCGNPRPHPVAERKHVVQFLALNRPLGADHLVFVGGLVVANGVHRVGRTPEVLGKTLLHFNGQAATHKVAVGMAHGIAVVLGVDDAPGLTVVLVGVVLGVAHFPVDGTVVVLPLFFGNTHLFKHIASAHAQKLAKLAFFVGNAVHGCFDEFGVAGVYHVPRNGLEFVRAQLLLPDAVFVHGAEIAEQLAVVFPHAQIVHKLNTHKTGLTRQIILFARKLGEPLAPAKHAHTCVELNGADAKLGRRVFILHHGIAADGARKTAVVAHGVLPHIVAQKVGGIVGAVGDTVERAHVARKRNRCFRCAPALARRTYPAGTCAPVFKKWAGKTGNHMLVVSPNDGAVVVDEIFPVGLVARNVHGLAALKGNGLEHLGTHDSANAATCGMSAAVDHHRIRNQIFTGGPDGGNGIVRAHFFADHAGGAACTLPPHVAGILDPRLAVTHMQPHGAVGLAFDNKKIIARVFQVLGKVAAHVARTYEVLRPRNRHDGGYSGTPAAQGARASQRPHGKNDFVGFVIGLGFGRNFVPKHLVAQARAANKIKILVGVLNSNAARAQVDPQALALIAAKFSGHKFLQLANGA